MLASGGDAFVKAKSIFVRDFSVAGMLFSLTGATATNQYFLGKYICNLQITVKSTRVFNLAAGKILFNHKN